MKLSIDIGYIVKRIVVIVLAFVIISSIKSCEVKAANCASATLDITYSDGSSWSSMSEPIVYGDVDKVSYKFTNNSINNSNVGFTSSISINTNGNISESDIKVYDRVGGSYYDKTNDCSISVSGNVPNPILPVSSSYSLYNKTISVACSYSANSGSNAANIIIDFNNANVENTNVYGCLKINPSDTDLLLIGMAQNTNNAIDSINDLATDNNNGLNNVVDAIQELFPNFGSCRKLHHYIVTPNKAFDSTGQEVDNSNYGLSGFIRIYPTDSLDRMKPSEENVYACFYTNMNNLIECQTERQVIDYTIPSNAYYVRFSWSQTDDSPETYHCSKNDQIIQNTLEDFLNDFSNEITDISNSLEGISSVITNTGKSVVDSQQVCKYYDKTNIVKENTYLDQNGAEAINNDYGITDYIRLSERDELILLSKNDSRNVRLCYYNINKTTIRCDSSTTLTIGKLTIPSGTEYVRFTIWKETNKPTYNICRNGNQGFLDFLDDTFVSDSNLAIGTSYFSQEIDTANNGLLAVITSPISILSRANDTCSSKSFVIFGKTISLPCGTTLFWEKDFSNYHSIFRSGLTGSGLNNARDSFRLFWNVFFGGAIILHLLIKLYMVISDALDPDSCTVRSINNAIDTSDVSSYVPRHSYEVNEAKRTDAISTGMSRSLKHRDFYVGTGGAKYYG